jgi:hypothetical protein
MSAVAYTTSQSFFEAAFETIATIARKHRARRAQRIALVTLMDMDASRLDDLGLNVHDVVEALHAQPAATNVLAAVARPAPPTGQPPPSPPDAIPLTRPQSSGEGANENVRTSP